MGSAVLARLVNIAVEGSIWLKESSRNAGKGKDCRNYMMFAVSTATRMGDAGLGRRLLGSHKHPDENERMKRHDLTPRGVPPHGD